MKNKMSMDQSMCSPRKQEAMGFGAGASGMKMGGKVKGLKMGGKVKGYQAGGMVDPSQAASAMASMMKNMR
tara:strand:+ start:1046 stop:1258 length:213 start_codon:yes stop_codon:yes gene_type:complete